MTILFLVRHALNDFVGSNKLAGWLPGVHLNERGQTQAKALASHFSQIKISAVFSSPLERAMETAAPIAEARSLKVIPRPGLGEIRYGTWQGKSLKTLRRRKLWPVIQGTPSLARFPEGESFPEAQARIVAEIDAIRAKYKGRRRMVVCVAHADVIKLAIAHYVGMPLDLFQRLTVAPASISILQVEDSVARLINLNDTHGAGPPDRG